MARPHRPRPLRYAKYRPIKLEPEIDKRLVSIAEDKGYLKRNGEVNVSVLLREIISKWIWGHDNGPGKDEGKKPKNEKLL